MLQALFLLAVMTNAAWRERVHRPDALEFNAYGQGSTQAIVWEFRDGEFFPQDWVTNPCGEWTGTHYFDPDGVIVQPREVFLTRTSHDPERAAYFRWAKRGVVVQGGIWRNKN